MILLKHPLLLKKEPENTTLKKKEHATTVEYLRPPHQDIIPNITTPASPHEIDRPPATVPIPAQDSKPPTPGNPFKQTDEQVPLDPPVPPLVPSAPPVLDKPETPARVVIPKSRLDLPTTPAGKTPLHKPRYTPSHPKQKTKKPKEPFTKQVVKEGLKEVSSSGYSPHITENPIEGKAIPSKPAKLLKPSQPLTIHSPPRRSYPICYPNPNSCPPKDIERIPPPPEQKIQSSSEVKDIDVQVVNLAIENMEQDQLKSLIEMLILRYEHNNRLEAMPSQESSTHDQVFHLGGKVGVDGGCEEPELDIELEAQYQLPSITKPNPTSTSHNQNQPTLQLPVTSVNAGNNSVTYPELQTSLQAMTEGLLKAALKEGVLRHDTPKLHEFTGKPEDGKATWRRWELQVKGLEGTYSNRAIKEAMNKALQGDAAIVADSLADNCT